MYDNINSKFLISYFVRPILCSFTFVLDGVYKSGFATKPEAYEKAVTAVFEHLDKVEKILAGGKEFLVGEKLTEADIRLFVTIINYYDIFGIAGSNSFRRAHFWGGRLPFTCILILVHDLLHNI